MKAKDRRFDGVFFVGVKTTGIYCRPICPARLPGRDRCEFFASAAQAEAAGYRACFRCRPELAPGHASVDAASSLVRKAAQRIEAGALDTKSVDELAKEFAVSSRHLRRVMTKELGVAPLDLALTLRLALAKRLVQDTNMPLTTIAFAAGFSSLRRFNDTFALRLGRPPSSLRRGKENGTEEDEFTLRLDYRPPFEWQALLDFLKARAIDSLEQISNGEYRRVVEIGDCVGSVVVSADPLRSFLLARISSSLLPKIVEVNVLLRSLFDLDAHPEAITSLLRDDKHLRRWVDARPGLRVPGSIDPFEVSVRAILGQQISVKGATTLAERFTKEFGRMKSSFWTFPNPAAIAKLTSAQTARIGLPQKRAETIVALAKAIDSEKVVFDPSLDPKEVCRALQHVPGIGPWTAHYIGMRALRWPDALPSSDLGLRRALGGISASAVEKHARAWQPWRSYAVMHCWMSLGETP